MRLGIDASNLRSGGGVRHLIELLRAAEPSKNGFSEVYVWGGRDTLSHVEERPWLKKLHQPNLDRGLLRRAVWQKVQLSRLARDVGCDLLLVPGSSYSGSFQPVVAMSRNMLPFEWVELRRYGWSLMALRLLVLRRVQSRTFRRADGVIFLTHYARDTIMKSVGSASGAVAIIPHGVEVDSIGKPRQQEDISRYSDDRPFRMIYVSIIDQYKHQSELAEATATLRAKGMPIVLELVGPAYLPSLEHLRRTIKRVDPGGEFVFYRGEVPHAELTAKYAQADLCVFASSCENMPNILLEGMASGLPIACSNRGPMPEVLGDAGVYFDPESPEDIARALTDLVSSSQLRSRLAADSFARVSEFSWDRCARDTFDFLAAVATRKARNPVSKDRS